MGTRRRKALATPRKPSLERTPEELLIPDPHEGRKHTGPVTYTDAEDEHHTAVILQLRLKPASFVQICKYCRDNLGIGESRVRRLLVTALEKLKADGEGDLRYAKHEAIARIRDRIRVLGSPRAVPKRGDPTRTVPAGTRELRLIARYEELLADLEGTRAPIEVNVSQVQHVAIVQVIADMTPEDRERLIVRANERKRLAEIAQAIDVTPVRRREEVASSGTAA